MVNRIILHIGMHKTGSSSIQHALKDFDNGHTFYPDLGYVNHSLPIVTCFSDNYQGYHIWRKKGLSKAMIEKERATAKERLENALARTGRETIIISGEGISLLDDKSKAALIETLKSHADVVDLICYVRDPLSFAASSLQQRVKGNLKALPSILSPEYRRRLESFSDMLPAENVQAIPFDRSGFPDGDVVKDFCSRIGIEPIEATDFEVNSSLTAPALKLAFLFNRTNPCFQGDAIVTRAKHRLVRTLANAYAGGEKIEKTLVKNVSDFSEVPFLVERFGETFAGWSLEGNVPSWDELYEWLSDTTDLEIAPLRRVLAKRGIKGNHSDASSLVNRLYYDELRLAATNKSPEAAKTS